MTSLLQGIPGVEAMLDDIIVTRNPWCGGDAR